MFANTPNQRGEMLTGHKLAVPLCTSLPAPPGLFCSQATFCLLTFLPHTFRCSATMSSLCRLFSFHFLLLFNSSHGEFNHLSAGSFEKCSHDAPPHAHVSLEAPDLKASRPWTPEPPSRRAARKC